MPEHDASGRGLRGVSDDRLAAILASVADHLVVPGAGGLVGPLEPNGSSPRPAEDRPTGSEAEQPSADERPPSAGGHGSSPPSRPAPPERPERPERPQAERSAGGRPPGRGSDGGDGRGPIAAPGTRWRRRLLAAAVIAVLVTTAGLVVAPVREAVAGWLGIGHTGVERVGAGVGEGDPGDLPYLASDLVPVDEDAAEDELGVELPATADTGLGPAPLLAIPPEGGVVMAWPEAATTLWVQQRSMSAHDTVTKLLTVDDGFARVAGIGDDAAVIEGPHVLETPLRRLAAGTVLIWVDGDLEYRLEGDRDRSQLAEIARAIANGGG